MLSWIPLVGPILQGLFSTASAIYSKFKDTQIEQIKAGVEDSKTAAEIVQGNRNSIGLRILTDAYCTPAVLHVLITGWDTIWAEHNRNMMWHLADFPPSYQWYLPSVAVFLVGYVGIKKFL